jgi:carbohydrate ABC transporter membrane protein 1, CUT1 family (TC 3.A.1.1.-)
MGSDLRSVPVRPPRAGSDRPRRTVRRHRWDLSSYFFLLPALVMSGLFVLYPLTQTVWISLHEWNGLSEPVWVGIQGFVDGLSSPRIHAALLHVCVLVLFFSIIPLSLGLVVAALLSGRSLPGLGFFRVVLFLPQVIAMVVTGIAWRWVLSPDGAVNEILRAIGLESLTRAWFGDFDTALLAVGVVGIWVVFGFCMVLFLSGIARLDPALYDAAQMDGAGPIRTFFAVTLPGVRPEMAVALTITVVGALKSFDVVYVTTAGGPGIATTVPALEVYLLAFRDGTVGSAAVVAVLLVTIILVVTTLLRRLTREENE